VAATVNHLGIIVALLPEAGCFVQDPAVNRPVHLSDKLTLIVSGIGQDRAGRAAEQLLAGGADALLSTGTAGALSPDLRPGNILIPETVKTGSGGLFPIASEWHEYAIKCFSSAGAVIHTNTLLSLDRVVRGSREKQQLCQDTAADAVDMESAAIMAVAAKHGIPALVIRTLLDPLSYTVPQFVLDNSDLFGKPDQLAIIKSLLQRPGRILQLVELIRYFRQACNSLHMINKHLHALLLP